MKNTYKYIILTCGAVLVLAAGFGAYKYNEHVKYENSVKENIASVKTVSGKYVAEKDDNKKFEDLKKLQKELKDYQNGNENDERVVKEYNKTINTLVKYFKDKNDKVLKDNTYDSSKETNKDVLQEKVNNLNELVKVVEGQKDVVYSTTLKEVKKADKGNKDVKETSNKDDKKSKNNLNAKKDKMKDSKAVSAEEKDKKKTKQNSKQENKSEFVIYIEKIKTIINGYNSKINQIKEEEKRKAEEAKRKAEEQKAREEGKVAFNANGQYVGEGSPEAVYNASGQTQEQVQAQSQYQNNYNNNYSTGNNNNYNSYNNGYTSSGNTGGSYAANNSANTGGSTSSSNSNDKGEYVGWWQAIGGERIDNYYKDGVTSSYDSQGNYLGKTYGTGDNTVVDLR